jgi:hypothetical protein
MPKTVEEDEEARLDDVDARDAEDGLRKDTFERHRHVLEKRRGDGNQPVADVLHLVDEVQAQLGHDGGA